MKSCKNILNHAGGWEALQTFLVVVIFTFASASLAWANTKEFEAEMILANNAEGRVARVEHLKRALELRPDHPDNIVLKYRIGIAMFQHGDPTSNTSPNPVEAIPWFRGILDRYQQADYYERKSPGGAWDAQLLIPKSAVQLATVLALTEQGNPQETREALFKGMDALDLTYRKRQKDWLEAPEPMTVEQIAEESAKYGGIVVGGRDVENKIKYRREAWRKRRDAAERGEVFNDREMMMVNASVGHYGASYGLQRPWEVKQAMRELIDRYPDTPIAKAAQDHIERAGQMVKQQVEKELAQLPNELFDNAPVVPQAVEITTPPVEASNDARKPLSHSPVTAPAVRSVEPSSSWRAWLLVGLTAILLVSVLVLLARRRRQVV